MNEKKEFTVWYTRDDGVKCITFIPAKTIKEAENTFNVEFSDCKITRIDPYFRLDI